MLAHLKISALDRAYSISCDGSAEKIAGPGCTCAAFALAPLAHHRAIVALLSDAHQPLQHLHPHQQVHQRR